MTDTVRHDGGRDLSTIGFLAIGAMTASSMVLFIGLFSLAPALPAIREHFSATSHADLLTQLIGAASGLSFAIACLVTGPVIARYGFRNVYLTSLLVAALAGAAGGVMPSLGAIFFTRVIVGIACAGTINAALVAIGRILTPSAQAQVLGLQGIVGAVCAVIGFAVVAQLAAVDWRLPFAVHLIVLGLLPFVVALPSAPIRPVSKIATLPARWPSGSVMAVASFVGMVAFIATMASPLLLADLGIRDPIVFALPPTVASVGSAIGAAVYVVLRPRLRLAGAFGLALAAMAVGLGLQGLSNSAFGVVAGAGISMMGGGMFTPNMNAAAIARSPDNPGPALGLLNALLYGSMILFPLIVEPLSALLGDVYKVLLAYAALAASFALYFGIGRYRERRAIG
jgi:hypothetical protein